MCAKHDDCGGVTKLQSGGYECRTRIFIEREGEISFQKPANFPVPMFTEEMTDPGNVECHEEINFICILVLEYSVRNLHPSDFDENDKMYDAGQYQYFIDENFEPKQFPGKAQIRELRVYHPILIERYPWTKFPFLSLLKEYIWGHSQK